MASKSPSEACCSIPPVSAKYTEKGTFEEIAGLRTYTTGSPRATVALILVYDVFGFSPQILQGADILSAPKSQHPFRVYMPDFLSGNLANRAWFPPNTAEKQAALAKYFGPEGPAQADKMINQLKKIHSALEGKFKRFAIMGYCWGAKIAVLSSFDGSSYSAAVQVHPSGLDSADASQVKIPMCMLASKDEDEADVTAFDNALRVPKIVDTYKNAPHGWMTARTNLEDPKMLEDYERGYTTVLNFLHHHL